MDHETSGEYNCIFKTDPLSKATVFVKGNVGDTFLHLSTFSSGSSFKVGV